MPFTSTTQIQSRLKDRNNKLDVLNELRNKTNIPFFLHFGCSRCLRW